MSKKQQAAKHPRETLKEHALRLIKEIQECPESMGTHCIQVLCDELKPLIRIADIQSPADLAPVAQPPIDVSQRLCLKCGHEERHSDNEGSICQKVRIAAQFPDGFDLVCACHCEFAAPLTKPY